MGHMLERNVCLRESDGLVSPTHLQTNPAYKESIFVRYIEI